MAPALMGIRDGVLELLLPTLPFVVFSWVSTQSPGKLLYHSSLSPRRCQLITPPCSYDASAHLSEETQNAAWSAPLGVLISIGVSAIFGFFLLIALLFSIQDFATTVDSEVGQPVVQILIDIFGNTGAIFLMVLVMICVWHCGLFSVTSNSRMMFGFSRDGGT